MIKTVMIDTYDELTLLKEHYKLDEQTCEDLLYKAITCITDNSSTVAERIVNLYANNIDERYTSDSLKEMLLELVRTIGPSLVHHEDATPGTDFGYYGITGTGSSIVFILNAEE